MANFKIELELSDIRNSIAKKIEDGIDPLTLNILNNIKYHVSIDLIDSAHVITLFIENKGTWILKNRNGQHNIKL